MKKIGVLDYGTGNVYSVCKALAASGAEVKLANRENEFNDCFGLVVPGVGSFKACMDGLKNIGADDLIREWVSLGKSLLGICVGHQVLFSEGIEHGEVTQGLDIFSGRVEKLPTKRLPHMGWNQLVGTENVALYEQMSQDLFYFVHSYAVLDATGLPSEIKPVFCIHENQTFLAGTDSPVISSTQFHPEKSAQSGVRLLTNWVRRVVNQGK